MSLTTFINGLVSDEPTNELVRDGFLPSRRRQSSLASAKLSGIGQLVPIHTSVRRLLSH